MYMPIAAACSNRDQRSDITPMMALWHETRGRGVPRLCPPPTGNGQRGTEPNQQPEPRNHSPASPDGPDTATTTRVAGTNPVIPCPSIHPSASVHKPIPTPTGHSTTGYRPLHRPQGALVCAEHAETERDPGTEETKRPSATTAATTATSARLGGGPVGPVGPVVLWLFDGSSLAVAQQVASTRARASARGALQGHHQTRQARHAWVRIPRSQLIQRTAYGVTDTGIGVTEPRPPRLARHATRHGTRYARARHTLHGERAERAATRVLLARRRCANAQCAMCILFLTRVRDSDAHSFREGGGCGWTGILPGSHRGEGSGGGGWPLQRAGNAVGPLW